MKDLRQKFTAARARTMRLSSCIDREATYRKQVLDAFDLRAFIARLESTGAKRVALFCVEELPGACHRSLVAERLWSEYGCKVQDL